MVSQSTRKAFTLIEMLIVIVIIGILAAALIPRVMGIQARARDTARTAHMRNTSVAVESYMFDHGSYPLAIYASRDSQNKNSFFISSVFAQTQGSGSSLDNISSLLSSYLTELPTDPEGLGLQADANGVCSQQGKNYAYYTDPGGSLYAITTLKESKKGNTSSCGDTIDRNNEGLYEKTGRNLITDISSEPTDENCFTASMAGILQAYNPTCPKKVVIPKTIAGVTITSIASYVFLEIGLTSLIIPNSVTTIGGQAFRDNNITSLIIPNSVTTIGNGAFRGNKITSLVIPESVISMGTNTFYDNNITSLIIPNSVTTIGDGTFYKNNLTSVTIPSSVTSIGTNTFQYNGNNQNSKSILGFVPSGTDQTRNLVGTDWIKQ